MADFKAITIDGTSYTVKDETARAAAQQANTTAEQANTTAGQANTTAQAAQNKANQNEKDITNLSEDSLVVSYVSESESIVFAKGIVLE